MADFTARGGWWVAAQAALLVLFTLALVLGGPVATPSWVRWVLALGGVVGLAVAAWLAAGGVKALGAGLTPYPEPQAGAALIEDGVYGRVRHPLYGAVVLGSAGLALVFASAWAGLASLALVAFFSAKSSFEERRLTLAHPGYADYRRRVPRRMFPWVG